MSLPVFNSKKVSVAWRGYALSGLAEDGISITPSADVTETSVGMDGQVSISFLPDETGQVTFSFQYQARTNMVLSGVLEAQRRTGELYVGDLAVSDPSSGVHLRLVKAHIQSKPEISIGSSVSGNTKDWTFFCERLEYIPNPSGVTVPTEVTTGISTILGSLPSS